jgi:hypothetical protein
LAELNVVYWTENRVEISLVTIAEIFRRTKWSIRRSRWGRKRLLHAQAFSASIRALHSHLRLQRPMLWLATVTGNREKSLVSDYPGTPIYDILAAAPNEVSQYRRLYSGSNYPPLTHRPGCSPSALRRLLSSSGNPIMESPTRYLIVSSSSTLDGEAQAPPPLISNLSRSPRW